MQAVSCHFDTIYGENTIYRQYALELEVYANAINEESDLAIYGCAFSLDLPNNCKLVDAQMDISESSLMNNTPEELLTIKRIHSNANELDIAITRRDYKNSIKIEDAPLAIITAIIDEFPAKNAAVQSLEFKLKESPVVIQADQKVIPVVNINKTKITLPGGYFTGPSTIYSGEEATFDAVVPDTNQCTWYLNNDSIALTEDLVYRFLNPAIHTVGLLISSKDENLCDYYYERTIEVVEKNNKTITKLAPSGISIYANPTRHNSFELALPEDLPNAPITISVYNLHGGIVHQQIVDRHRAIIDTPHLKSGYYIIGIRQDGQLLDTIKITKTN